MLTFWYSARCTREIRLIICIAVCAVIYYCAGIQQLPALFAGLSLALGAAVHLLRHVDLKLADENSYRRTVQAVFSILPIAALLGLILYLPQGHKAVLSTQCIGFSAIGLFLVSLYECHAKRLA
ncbi:hypothetical protein [Acinetobacter sp.]|uniref:hypothetical protein n=1 Tax=Acinetobacter sp. TaxID=472 RepID=UPI002FC9BA38